MTRLRIAVLATTLTLSVASSPARAQFFNESGMVPQQSGNIEGFSVTGKGVVSAKPNRLEIDLDVSASSELSADAIVKYRDAKKRLQDAFTALKLKDVTVEERGMLVDQKGAEYSPYFFDYQPNRRNKVEVQITRKLVVSCSEIRKLDEEALLQLVAKLLDVAQDAGGKVGGQNQNSYYYYRYGYEMNNGLIRFILDDYEKLEEEAYAKAVEDAQSRAKRLAKLSGVKLGPVTAVREASSPRDRQTTQADEIPRKRLEASKFQEIPVKVDLVVRFNATPLPEKAGQP